MGHVLFPLGGGSDTSAVTATAPDIVSGKVIIDSNGNLITGTMPTMAGSTITPSKSRQTISCSGKKMTSNIIVKAISDQYTQLQPGQVVFPEGVSPELIGVHPYYPTNRSTGIGHPLLEPSTTRISFNGNYPMVWSTANYYGEVSQRLLFLGSVDIDSKYSAIRITASRRATIESGREDRFDLHYYDINTKKHVESDYGDYIKVTDNVDTVFTTWVNRYNNRTGLGQVFVVIDVGTDYSDDPNGGNHFFTIKKVELVPK